MYYKPINKIYCCIFKKVVLRIFYSLVCCAFLWPINTVAQAKYTVSGTVKDIRTGESLIGATVICPGLKQSGVVTNDYGFYSLTLPAGSYAIQISYVGYHTTVLKIDLYEDKVLNPGLNADNELKEVVVNGGGSTNENISSPQMGVNKLDVEQVSAVPVLLGEKDILKTIQLLPGIKTTGDANTGYYVRGGAADQNLVLLDGAQVYNATHLFGFFSIFNSDAIKDVSLYKGGIPAEYGGRLSSVLDIKMDEGNNNQYGVEGGIGLISSRIKVDGPIIKGKSSFMLSARRTYADIFLKLSGDSSLSGSNLYFYDLNAKLNYHLNDKNILYFSSYYGKDEIALKDNFGTNWGNTAISLRWNRVYSSKLFANTSFIYSSYNYGINNYSDNNIFNVSARLNDYGLKQDFTWFASNNNRFNFGLNLIHHVIAPGNITSSPTAIYNSTKIESRYSYETAAYMADEFKLSERISLVYGVRLNLFSLIGPGVFRNYDAGGNTLDSATYHSGAIVKSYFTTEPRFTANYTLNDRASVKVSYNHTSQNIHLLSNSTTSLPTDLYIMSSNNVKPGVADQYSVGYFRNISSKGAILEFSAEAYYKWLKNQIDYKNNAQLLANENVESQLIYGTGRAYGIEFYLKKKYGRLNGWITYTLSRVEDKFNGVNHNAYFPARQDRTHDISVVGIYKLSGRITLSSVFVYGTGNAVTFPDGKYTVGGITTYYYSGRNQYRLPSDNRLDIGLTLNGKKHKRFESGWTFSIYNVYNHRNPYSIIFKDSSDSPPHTQAIETSLFGIIPSVTWNFKFQ